LDDSENKRGKKVGLSNKNFSNVGIMRMLLVSMKKYFRELFKLFVIEFAKLPSKERWLNY
jgi:hypothetical protein